MIRTMRAILLLAVLVSLIVAPVGCAPAAPADEGEGATGDEAMTELVIWSVGAGSEDFQRELVQKFNSEHPGVELSFDPALAGLEFLTEGMQKLRIAYENQAGPDIMGGVDAGCRLGSRGRFRSSNGSDGCVQRARLERQVPAATHRPSDH